MGFHVQSSLPVEIIPWQKLEQPYKQVLGSFVLIQKKTVGRAVLYNVHCAVAELYYVQCAVQYSVK